MQVIVEKLDDLGRGIALIDNKVTFIPNCLPKDIVDIKITKEKKNYNEGEVISLIKKSPLRIEPKCPFFSICGGCQLQNLTYEKTVEYKKEKVINLFKKNKIDINGYEVANPSPYNYRNKINLKVVNGKMGFFVNKTHSIVEIDKCILASNAINESIPLIKKFNIINGEVTIRCNQNDELLISILSNDLLDIDITNLQEQIKLVGIVINNKTYYGKNYLFEKFNNLLFKISYDSFFQVNPYVASKLFKIIEDNINEADKVLDLYCGVGTLSLCAAKKALNVLGIEVVENALFNALFNAKINGFENVKFILNDVTEVISKISWDFNKVIVDPPRSGLSKKTIDVLLKIKPDVIIYVSCDPQTLVRDYKLLSTTYKIDKACVLDMFSYTYHVESVLVLRKTQKRDEL